MDIFSSNLEVTQFDLAVGKLAHQHNILRLYVQVGDVPENVTSSGSYQNMKAYHATLDSLEEKKIQPGVDVRHGLQQLQHEALDVLEMLKLRFQINFLNFDF